MERFFAPKGQYMPCGMFSNEHFVFVGLTIILIIIGIFQTRNMKKEQVKQLIQMVCILIIGMEIVRIALALKDNSPYLVNTYMPLYYCSCFIYALILSGFTKGTLKRIGDIFLATGCFVGGAIFLIFPSTSITYYPAFHFMSVHSFIFHGLMIYISILVNKTKYVEYSFFDMKYYSILISIICLFAYVFNKIFDSNLMFISQSFNNIIISFIYTKFNKIFTPLMCIIQITIPFIICYLLKYNISQNMQLIKNNAKNLKKSYIKQKN